MSEDAVRFEAETILREGGASEALVRADAAGWLVRATFGGAVHVGHTGIDPSTSGDPRDMARRLVALARPKPVAPSASMPLPLLPEDEGQQAASDIFTEEDLEALGAVAVEGEASEDAADDAGSAENASSPPVEDTANVSEDRQPAYPGVALLPDELGARRNAVLAAIATEKLTRLSIAMDPSRADFLAARFAEYQNAGALGLAIDDALAADYRAFQDLRDRRDRITTYAMQLEQSALDGDMDRLSAMHAGLGDGWP